MTASQSSSDTVRPAPRVFDGHNDLAWELRAQAGYDFNKLDIAAAQASLQTDIPRLRAGDVGAQFWSVWVPDSLAPEAAVVATLQQIDAIKQMVARYPETFEFVTDARSARRVIGSPRIACLIGAEGGHSIGSSLSVLRILFELGVRYMTLTHNATHDWADSATDAPRHGGLSDFGRRVVQEMNDLGMIVDLSHVARTTMRDALNCTKSPVMFSHSGASEVCDVPRNVPDDILQAMQASGGICMVPFVPRFLSDDYARWHAAMPIALDQECLAELVNGEQSANRGSITPPHVGIEHVADHLDHIRDLIGVDHVGIGADFDGGEVMHPAIADVSKYPDLFRELRRRHWSTGDIQKVANLNVLRVLEDNERS